MNAVRKGLSLNLAILGRNAPLANMTSLACTAAKPRPQMRKVVRLAAPRFSTRTAAKNTSMTEGLTEGLTAAQAKKFLDSLNLTEAQVNKGREALLATELLTKAQVKTLQEALLTTETWAPPTATRDGNDDMPQFAAVCAWFLLGATVPLVLIIVMFFLLYMVYGP